LYKTSFLLENKIRFSDDVYAEDRLFNLICYINKPNIAIVNKYTYFYNIIDNSRSRTFPENFFEQSVSLLHIFNSFIEKLNSEANKELLQINAIYEIEKTLNYYYTYTGSIKGVKEAIRLLKA